MKNIIILIVMVSLLFGLGGIVYESMSYEIGFNDTVQFTVGPNDTIWEALNTIKGRENIDGHMLVSLIKEMNNLENSMLRVGQTLIIPEEVYRK